MPINKEHAFGGGVVYSAPDIRRSDWVRRFFRNPLLVLKLIVSHYINPSQFRISAAWRQIRRNATFHPTVRIGPNAWCTNYQGRGRNGDIVVAENTIIRGIIRIEAGGKVEISRNVYIGDDVIISSSCHVRIGAYSSLAHGVHVFDNDSHPMNPMDRRNHTDSYYGNLDKPSKEVGSAEIIIGEDVWIGFNSFIAKGVSIGDGSVVAACSVVTKDVAPGVLVAGNPAREIRKLSPSS